MAGWTDLLAGSAGGGGSGYGGSGGNSSSISTPVNTDVVGGSIGALNLDFSNRAFAPQSNTLLIIAAVLVGAWLLMRK